METHKSVLLIHTCTCRQSILVLNKTGKVSMPQLVGLSLYQQNGTQTCDGGTGLTGVIVCRLRDAAGQGAHGCRSRRHRSHGYIHREGWDSTLAGSNPIGHMRLDRHQPYKSHEIVHTSTLQVMWDCTYLNPTSHMRLGRPQPYKSQ